MLALPVAPVSEGYVPPTGSPGDAEGCVLLVSALDLEDVALEANSVGHDVDEALHETRPVASEAVACILPSTPLTLTTSKVSESVAIREPRRLVHLASRTSAPPAMMRAIGKTQPVVSVVDFHAFPPGFE
jgi:hypothetical protein